MLPIPYDILTKFDDIMEKKSIHRSLRADFRKWLRYYLDFRIKYPPPVARSEHVRLFIEKLRSKNQSQKQIEQAAYALSLFFASQSLKKQAGPSTHTVTASFSPVAPSHRGLDDNKRPVVTHAPLNHPLDRGNVGSVAPARVGTEDGTSKRGGKRYNEWRCMERSKSPEWDEVIDKLAAEIKTKHYSRKTLKTYALWSRQFQRFLKNKEPNTLSTEDVKSYLTYLAVKRRVSASTQNQAFNSLTALPLISFRRTTTSARSRNYPDTVTCGRR